MAFYISFDIGNKIHLLRKAQIAHLKVDKALIEVFNEYIDFVDIFLLKLDEKLLKHININNYIIKLVDNCQFYYSHIDSLGFVKLEILKAYIKKNLANSFIKLFKFFARAAIFFNKKLNKSSRFYTNYQDFNNFTIKN